MTEILRRRLFHYLQENNPDLLLLLEEEKTLEEYLQTAMDTVEPLLDQLLEENHPPYSIEEICFDHLTCSLRPSKFNYIKALTAEKFPLHYKAFERTGILQVQLVNLVTICLPLFEAFRFSEENEGDERLRYVITRTLKEYFTKCERQTVKSWPITPINS